MYKIYFNLSLLYLFSCAYSSSLPSFITPCKINQDEQALSKCILDEARKVQKQFVKGIPELGVEALEPLALGKLNIGTGTIDIKQNNLLVKGVSKLELREIKMSAGKTSGKIAAFGNLTVTSDYDVDGRLLVLPIKGNGKMRLKMENTEIVMKYKTKLVRGEDGKEHVFIYDVRNSYSFGNVRIRMDGLFGNDKTLGDTVNQVINENWRDLMKDFGPPSVKAVSERAVEILNEFYAKVPYDELFSQQ